MLVAQQKILRVNDALGNRAIATGQGTTFDIFHELPIQTNAGSTYNFFEQMSSSPFPRSNRSENQLQVAQSFLVETIAMYGVDQTGLLVPLEDTGVGQRAVMNFSIGNSVVLKNQNFGFGKKRAGIANEASAVQVLHLANVGLVIPPLIRFKANVQLSAAIDGLDFRYIGCRLEGTAVLLRVGQV